MYLTKIKKMLKGSIKSKTINTNVAILIVAAGATYFFPQLTPYLNDISMAIAACVNIYLRMITVEGLIKKGE